MGNKIITEKDFFQCSGGMMPSPFQSTQLIVKKKTGQKYITLNDTSTVSWVDFGCKKLMLLYAVIAAIAVVAVALIVGTGGLALVAVAAAAGAIGAVMGAIDGSSICGQKVSPVRKWMDSNANFQILGINTITGDHKMICNAFTMLGMSSEYITFNPNIKNWSQAIKMGSASFAANVLQGAMTGMMIGGAAVALPALAEGGAAALTESGGMGLARYLGGNVAKNYLASWFTAEGLGLRGVMGVQSGLDAYGQTGTMTNADIDHGITGMESGTVQSVKNIGSGQGNILDVIGLALWFTPAGEMIKGKTTEPGSRGPAENTKANPEAKNENKGKNEEENAKPANQAEAKPEEVKPAEEEAFQADKPLDEKITESQQARDKALSEYDQLGTKYESKTVATDGIKTVSGWKASPEGFTDVSPEQVKDYSDQIGHTPQKAGAMDQVKDGGFEGKYNSSHAEKKVLTENPNDPTGVSRPMCSDCQSFAQKQAVATGKEVIVSDPEGTHIFNPDGTHDFIPK
ncbi:MAG: hypothetical protein JWR38_4621 [Mucilaginibacter sp.]|nr:hypothetical protein [Mucilaginibacter sp.]